MQNNYKVTQNEAIKGHKCSCFGVSLSWGVKVLSTGTPFKTSL